MPRNVPPSLEGRLNAQVTATGYLLRMVAGASVMQLCDIGTVTNADGTWTHEDFSVKGAGTENVGLSVENLNGAAGALALNADALSNVQFLVWQIERGDIGNPVLLGEFRAANAKVGIDRCDFALRQVNLAYRFAPIRRINARDGFKFALRPGEILLWGAQRIFIEDRR